jgi:peptidylprolyl isomerase
MRRTLALVLAAALALAAAACGDEEPLRATGTDSAEEEEPLADIEVEREPSEKPTLTFDQPYEVDETTVRTIEEGDGEPIEDGAVISFDFLLVNGRDGTELSTSYGSQPAELTFEESLMAGIYKGLDGVPAGSIVLVAIAPDDGLGEDPSQGVLDTDTLLLYVEVHTVVVPLERAEGTAVEPVPGLPTVELADNGEPTITMPDGDPPAELVAQSLIEGEGDVVEAGQAITVHYTGALYSDGSVFDSSWESGAPHTFDIGTGAVIPGWDEGLVGKPVGSQVLLVVPPDMGYPDGSADGSIPKGATIVFVVDILAAQ